MKRFRMALLAGLAMIVLAAAAAAQECYTPLEWQPKCTTWSSDANHNSIEDAIESFPPDSVITVIACLNDCPTSNDLSRLQSFGAIDHIGPYIPYAILHGVRVSNVPALAADVRVALVELNHPYVAFLDVANPAVKVRTSATYSPNTVQDAMPGLTGAG